MIGEIDLPSNAIQANGSDHDDNEVAHPVTEHTNGGGLVTAAQRLDLSRVTPGHRKDTQSEAVEVEEHKRDCGRGGGVGLVDEAACDNGHADGAADRREDDGPSTADLEKRCQRYEQQPEELEAWSTNLINVEVRRPRENGVLGEGHRREDQRHRGREVEVRLEDVRKVVAKCVDSTPLVHHVWTHAEDNTLKVARLRCIAENFRPGWLLIGVFGSDGFQNLVELTSDLGVVLRFVQQT